MSGAVRRLAALCAALILMTTLSACARVVTAGTAISVEDKRTQELVDKLATATETAFVYSHTPVAERRVSLVLEGYADEAIMMELADILKKTHTDAYIFISGVSASDHPAVAKYIADAGVELGSYGLTGGRGATEQSSEKNARQLYKAQEAIFQAAGVRPSFLLLNGGEYSEELLKLAKLTGLDGAVTPTVYLNHRSFTEKANAANFVSHLLRGSIISIKLGQELDESEFQQGAKEDERPAVDKQPTIEDGVSETENNDYENLVNVLNWLLEALEDADYEVVTLKALERSRMESDGEALKPDSEALAALDPALYPSFNTDKPLGVEEGAEDRDFSGVLFIGDFTTQKLQSYVETRRTEEPDFMAGAEFAAAGGLSVSAALRPLGEDSRHPVYEGERRLVEDIVALSGAETVYLMLGANELANYTVEAYVENYRALLYLIREKSPDVRLCVQSVLPSLADAGLSSEKIFACDLALARLCLECGYDYIDAAYALRGADGALPPEYCEDAGDTGLHLSDEACAVWTDYLISHRPQR